MEVATTYLGTESYRFKPYYGGVKFDLSRVSMQFASRGQLSLRYQRDITFLLFKTKVKMSLPGT